MAEFELDEITDDVLCRMLGVDVVPEAVVRTYGRVKRLCDKVGSGQPLSAEAMAIVVLMSDKTDTLVPVEADDAPAEVGPPPPPRNGAKVDWSKIPAQSEVSVDYRGKLRPGRFVTTTPDNKGLLIRLLEGKDREPKTFPPGKVRLVKEFHERADADTDV